MAIFADILVIKADLHTLFGMAAGIAVITGLICFVLKLYSRARYSPPRHYANAGLPPPILFASETGVYFLSIHILSPLNTHVNFIISSINVRHLDFIIYNYII